MPASEKLLAHLKRLNATTRAAAHRFKPGHWPERWAWPPVGRHIENGCPGCGGRILRNTFLHGRQCQACWRKRSRVFSERVIALYDQGLTLRAIAEETGRAIGSVAGTLHAAKIRRRWGTGRPSREKLLREMAQACELCGYSRHVDLAHITPRAKAGEMVVTNLLSLCPNCHHLFDHNMLTDEERLRLDAIIEARRSHSVQVG